MRLLPQKDMDIEDVKEKEMDYLLTLCLLLEEEEVWGLEEKSEIKGIKKEKLD